MSLIIFGLGSNIGSKSLNLQKACSLLNFYFGSNNLLQSSSIYESLPLVQEGSPDNFSNYNYYNSAVAFNLNLPPSEVFENIKRIEKEMGRGSAEKWAPRIIDIDILIYENNELDLPNLQIPHKELMKRDFALLPLIEILKNLNLDTTTYREALKKAKYTKVFNQLNTLNGKKCRFHLK